MRKNRAVSALLAMVLAVTMALGVSVPAGAAVSVIANEVSVDDVVAMNNSSTPIRSGGTYSITILAKLTDDPSIIPIPNETVIEYKDVRDDDDDPKFNLGYAWDVSDDSEINMKIYEPIDDIRSAELTVRGVEYNRTGSMVNSLELTSLEFESTYDNSKISLTNFSVTIPQTYFLSNSGGSGNSSNEEDDPETFTPAIIIEAVRTYDKSGKLLEEVDEDTAPFIVEIYFSDFGLIGYEDDIYEESLEIYATNISGFQISANRGRLVQVGSNSRNDAPRFSARFTDVTYSGEGGNTFGFRAYYDIWGSLVAAEGTATVTQAAVKEEEENEIPPATPHIIVSQYSYGEEQIVAGNEFTLNITYQNTSADVALENIVMTITPKSEHTTIAAASNTVYIDSLAATGAMDHPIALKALPAASGSQNVDISFQYEYIVEVNSDTKERKTGEDLVSISIPVVQLDRFAVDPITDITEYVTAGDQFFVTVAFVNEGKAPIYNISARARGVNKEIISGTARVEGTLAASANDELELDVICNEAGDLMGEVVITYEDENTIQKEVVMPFNLYLEEPYVPEQPFDPGMTDPGMMGEQPPPPLSPATARLSIVGGLIVMAAFARYTAKRVIAKDSEEFDEDF